MAQLSGLLCSLAILASLLAAVLAPSIAYAAGTWQNPLTQQDILFDVDFPDATHGWAVGQNGAILATADGGESWSPQPSETGDTLRGVTFVDANHGWAVGGSSILRTIDGGTTWTKQLWTGAGSVALKSVSFSDSNHGWAVGTDYVPPASNWDQGYPVGVVLVTTDGGLNWRDQGEGRDSATGLGLNCVVAVDPQNAWGVGHGNIVSTHDGGETWATHSYVIPSPSPYYSAWFSSVYFPDATHGWAVGTGGTVDGWGAVIFATTDSGATWTLNTAGPLHGNLLDVTFSDANHGWAVGLEGYGTESAPIVYATTDGGVTWSSQYTGSKNYPFAILFPDDTHGWIVGDASAKGILGGSIQSYGSDPVRQPTDENAPAAKNTKNPVLLLIAGLGSDTDNEANKGMWGEFEDTLVSRYGLSRDDMVVVPTASKPPHQQQADVIDSQGNVYVDIARLANWLENNQGIIRDRPIIFVGHSYGGVMARGFVSSSAWLGKSRLADQIAGIIQLGTPNGGSYVADAANGNSDLPSFLHEVFGTENEATKSLSVDAMTAFNASRQNTQGYTIDRIGGNYLPLSLPVYDTPLILNEPIRAGQRLLWDLMRHEPGDGLVSMSSLNTPDVDFGGGGYWLPVYACHSDFVPGSRDVSVAASDAFGNPVVNPLLVFRGVDPMVVPRSDDSKDIATLRTFYDMMTSLTTAWRSPSNSKQRGGMTTGSQQLRASAGPGEPLSGTTATTASLSLPGRTVTVAAGSTTPMTLALDSTTTLVLSSTESTPTLSVTGATIDSTSSLTSDGVHQTLVVITPDTPGLCVLRVGLADSAAGTVALSGVAGGGASLDLSAARFSSVVGDEVVVTATVLGEGGSPESGATVTAVGESGAASASMTLKDDGVAADAIAADGVYSTNFTPASSGTWVLRANAVGTTFERSTSTVLSVGDGEGASFAAPLTEVAETSTGGTISRWGVEAPVSVTAVGDYTFTCDLVDSAGTLITQAAAQGTLSVGATTLTAWVKGREFQGMAAGTLTVTNARLTRLTDDGEHLADTAGDLTVGPYAAGDFYAFGIQLPPLATDPSPSGDVLFSGTAIYTSGTIAAVEYSLDGAVTWIPATPPDGVFDSATEAFSVSLSLPDNAYGLLVRAQAGDGTMLPPEDWAGDRFIVDTTAPSAVTDLSATAGADDFTATWVESESPQLDRSAVYYEVALDGTVLGTTGEPSFVGARPEEGTHSVTVTAVDEAGNRGEALPVATMSVPLLRELQPGWQLVAGGPGSDTLGNVLFAYGPGGYQSTTANAVEAGHGYWVKFTSSGTASLTVVPAPVTVHLLPGWNLIGNPTAAPLSLPTGLVAFTFDGSGYTSTTTLLPGLGAWVKALSAGDIVLEPEAS